MREVEQVEREQAMRQALQAQQDELQRSKEAAMWRKGQANLQAFYRSR
jgi:hypothetical protein